MTLIEDFWRTGLQNGRFVQWCTILEAELPELPPDLWLAYGICLRRVGHWDLVAEAFRYAAQGFGRGGDFAGQTEVLLEWATLMRMQGDYVKAVALVDQAERCNVLREDTLVDRCKYERSQIALDRGDGHAALEAMIGITRTRDTEILRADALLLLEEYEACRQTAFEMLASGVAVRRVEASLYTLIGRSCAAEGRSDEAETYFSLALNILEPTHEVSAIARAQANLAAILLSLGKAQQAQMLLECAKPVLKSLDDTVGYHAVMHNLRLTDIYQTRLL